MSRIWVADTCALIDVRRCVVPADKRMAFAERRDVFRRLDTLVEAGRLVFPPETVAELKEGAKGLEDPSQDEPLAFVERCRKKASRTAKLVIVKELGAHTLVRQVVDPDREKEEADIYVLSLALELQRDGNEVGVLTEERRDLDRKLSVNTACGLLGLVCLRMRAFLHQEGIWVWNFGGG